MATKYDKDKKIGGLSLKELGIYDFGDGPWNYEPDRLEWFDAPSKLPCMVLRGPLGNLNGYVGVPQGHAAFGADYSELELPDRPHGGLTYSDFDNKWITFLSDDVGRRFWLGFDCGHAFDTVPALEMWANVSNMRALTKSLGSRQSYKTIKYVQKQTIRLAAALHAYDIAAERK